MTSQTYFSEEFESIQKEIQKFSAISVIQIALEQTSKKRWGIESLESLPWIGTKIVEWSIKSNNSHLFLGPSITAEEYHNILFRLWNLHGKIKANTKNFDAALRSILTPQFDFQNAKSFDFLRIPSLIIFYNNHKMITLFKETLSISPEDYIDSCILIDLFCKDKAAINEDEMKEYTENCRKHLRKILSIIGPDPLELRSRIQNRLQPEIWEPFETSFTKEFPLIQAKPGNWTIWHPHILRTSLEELPHLKLSRLKGTYTKEFSRIFEKYVTDLGASVCSNAITEADWKKNIGHNATSVEIIIPEAEATIFIEAKMSLFRDIAITTDDQERLEERLEHLIKAIDQASKVSNLIRVHSNKYPKRAKIKEEYLIIVTNRDLLIKDGDHLSKLLPPNTIKIENSPLSLDRIFILPIADFENLCTLIKSKELTLTEILRSANKNNKNPETFTLRFNDHLRRFSQKISPPEIIINAAKESSLRLFDRPLIE